VLTLSTAFRGLISTFHGRFIFSMILQNKFKSLEGRTWYFLSDHSQAGA
jgi:hypothetical protein